MKFVLSEALAALIAISFSVVPGRSEFDSLAETQLDPAVTGLVSNINKEEGEDRKLTYVRGASSSRPPPVHAQHHHHQQQQEQSVGGKQTASKHHKTASAAYYDSQSALPPPELASAGTLHASQGEGALQPFEQHTAVASGQNPCDQNIHVDFYSEENEPDMTVQFVAPKGTTVVDIKAIKDADKVKEDVVGVVKGTYYSGTACLDMSTKCYVLIIRNTKKAGFTNGYAQIMLQARQVFTISGNNVWCGADAECGDGNGYIYTYTDDNEFTFNSEYVYAAIGGRCEMYY